MSGRFGAEYSLRAYVANNGSVHHGSYSSAALAWLLLSKVAGSGLLALRAVPLFFSAAALAVWLEILRRRVGAGAAAAAGVGLFFVPTIFLGLQLSFLGCHPESVLPLALLVGSWLLWLDGGGRDARASALFGACLGYSGIFSYLLWPFMGLMLVLGLALPGRPRPDGRALGAGLLGLAAGLWPLWLTLGLSGPAAFRGSITEDPGTTLAATALGGGADWDLFWRTLRGNLPYGFSDYWLHDREPGRLWGGERFEPRAYAAMVLAPLCLLPWAVRERATTRSLLLFCALAPALAYAWLAWASPWKPAIPHRYYVPLAMVGLSAPGIALGLGVQRARAGDRSGWALFAAGALLQLWLLPPRLVEAVDAVRLERAPALLRHRYVSYYNLGIGTVWAEEVDDVNDLVDVRSAEGRPEAFAGVQVGLWWLTARDGLPEGDWQPPEAVWQQLRGGLSEWRERQDYLPDPQRDDSRTVGLNAGWGWGIRTRWDPGRFREAVEEAAASELWRPEFRQEDFWEGFGFGWGRARSEAPEQAAAMPEAVPAEFREAAARGVRSGRARGAVPKAPMPPVFRSVRGPAT